MLMQWKTTSDPFFNDLRFLSRQVDEVFRELLPVRPTPRRGTRGPFRIRETDDKFTLRAALPGVRADDLVIEAKGDTLTVRASRRLEAPEGYKVHRSERRDSVVERTFTFGSKFELDQVEAKLEHGLLTITLPKQPAEQPRTIAIEAA